MSIEQTIAEAVRRAVRDEIERLTTPPKVNREALSVPETAEALGVSPNWVYAAIREHGLPARKAGDAGRLLVPTHALRRWLEAEPAAVTKLREAS